MSASEAAAKKLDDLMRADEAIRLRAATFHTTRHTFASWLIQAGVPLAEVEQYLGHSSDHMVRRYAHLAPAREGNRDRLEILAGLGTNQARETCPDKTNAVKS